MAERDYYEHAHAEIDKLRNIGVAMSVMQDDRKPEDAAEWDRLYSESYVARMTLVGNLLAPLFADAFTVGDLDAIRALHEATQRAVTQAGIQILKRTMSPVDAIRAITTMLKEDTNARTAKANADGNTATG